MIINIQYDSTVTSQSQTFQNQFKAAVNAAVAFYEHAFTNPITITINLGWGEVDGMPIGNSAAAGSFAVNHVPLTYSQVYAALGSRTNTIDTSVAFSSLPATDPTSGSAFLLTSAEAQALGVPTGLTSTQLTNYLYIGLSSSDTWSFDPNNRAAPGARDAIGAIEHEISEVMGRYGSLGHSAVFGVAGYTPLDLFRYASAGIRQLTYGSGWFSIDGQNLLMQYNDPTHSGDAADWTSSTAFDSYGSSGVNEVDRVAATDLREMNVIGYNRGALTVDNFNGNGVSDILFWNPSSGDVGWYNMQGSLIAWNDIAGSSTAYSVVGTGGFLRHPRFGHPVPKQRDRRHRILRDDVRWRVYRLAGYRRLVDGLLRSENR
jgi:hypothetical protein